MKIVSYYNQIGPKSKNLVRRNIQLADMWSRYPIGFFDGETPINIRGSETYIVLKLDNFYTLVGAMGLFLIIE